MEKLTFEELLRRNEEDLCRIRSQFFPLIENGTITGYNIYQSVPNYSDGGLFLDYLHAYLRLSDRHFKELSKLSDFVPVIQFNIREILGGELVTLSTLVGNKAQLLHNVLTQKVTNLQTDQKYVLRAFVEEYLDKP
ncbi:MAG: hypothetical protein AABY07_05165 [Nanoarchaeota archaeon]